MGRPLTSRLPILLAFASGSALSPWVAVHWAWALLSLALFFPARRLRYASCYLPLLALVIGGAWGGLRLPLRGHDSLEALVARAGVPVFCWVRGTAEHCEAWTEGSRCTLHATSYRLGSDWLPCVCSVRAYLPTPPPAEDSVVEASLRLTVPTSDSNPGQFNTAAYLERQGISLVGSSRAETLVKVEPPPWYCLVSRYRQALRERIRLDTGKSAGTILALLLGERGLMPPGTQEALSRSGLFHLVALSGLHVGLLLLLIALAAHGLNLAPSLRDLLSIVLLGVYGLLIAGRPSISRALLMALLFLLAQLFARPHGARTAWAAALALLLAIDPRWAQDTGFQLTFLATLGILVLWDAYPSQLPVQGIAGGLCRLLWIGFSSQVAILPLIVLVFHRVSLLGWLATPLASLPLLGIQALGLPYLLGLAFVPGLHGLLGGCLELFSRAFLFLPERLGNGAWGSLFVPIPAWGWISLYGLALVLLAFPGRRRRVGWVLAALSVVGCWCFPAIEGHRHASLAVLDVGQASCQVLQWNDRTYLIDAGEGDPRGPGTARTVVEPFLAREGVRGLQGIILTHWDSDHSGASLALMKDMPVGFLAYPSTDPPSHGLPELLAATALSAHTRLRPLSGGQALDLNGLSLAVLSPSPSTALTDENDRCIVARADFPGGAFLFTGDIEERAEVNLVNSGILFPAYGLMVPHHGSATSSTMGFLKVSRPRVAIISAGRWNRYGHPSPAVVERYAAMGTRIYRTDEDGAVLLLFEGRRPLALRFRDGDWTK
jgi:competence protein ComEC